jgi:hypothetical protein
MLTSRHFVLAGAATAALTALPGLSRAQTWNPTQTVTMVVPDRKSVV